MYRDTIFLASVSVLECFSKLKSDRFDQGLVLLFIDSFEFFVLTFAVATQAFRFIGIFEIRNSRKSKVRSKQFV